MNATPTLVLAAALLLLAVCNSSGSNELEPDDQLEIYTETAYVHYEQGDLERAMSQALKGLAIDRDHLPLNLMVGWILLRRDTSEDLLRAEQVFRRLEDEEDFRIQLGLATALERLGTAYQEAADGVRSGERATDAADAELRAQELAAEAESLRREALTHFEGTLAERPDNLKALNGAQRVTAALGDLEGSLSWTTRLLETAAAEEAFWRTQLEREELTAEAERDIRVELQRSTQLQVVTHLFAASTLRALGNPVAAARHLDAVAQLDPTLPEVYSRRAQALAESGAYEDAIDDIDRFLSLYDHPFEHPDVQQAFSLRTEWERRAATE